MKVIFLDIDGVLNLRHRGRDRFGSTFHKKFVNNLSSIIEATDARIVISSSWRHNGLAEMKTMWEARKLPGEVIDVTDSIRLQRGMISSNVDTITKQALAEYPGYSIPRGCEIEYWLKRVGNFQRINWSVEEQLKCIDKALVKNYIILDDDSDMLYCQREHFIKCSSNFDHKQAIEGYGLTSELADRSIEILNKDISDLYFS